MDGPLGMQLQEAESFSFVSVYVWIFEVNAAHWVDETLAADSRSVWPSEHVSGKGNSLAVFSLSG